MGSERVGYELLGTQFEPIDFLHLIVHWQITRYCGMKGMKIKEKEGSAIGMYIRSTSDIAQKWKDIRNSYMLPNRDYMRSIADITELGEICLRDCLRW
jgi:hypothetical protein